ncbi:MAG: hypothetical protein Q9210_005350 [Variospora velana]
MFVAAEGRWANIGYHMYTTSDDPGAKYLAFRNIETHYTNTETMAAMARWVNWVLEVLDKGNAVRLRPTDGQDAHYVALSYAWGGNIAFSTTESTYMSRHQPFPISELPQTLQDAVHVTRELEVRYLWVDSLCIIQDSYEDKSKEIAKMGDIYENAFATISATNAMSAYSGFLNSKYTDASSQRLPFFYPDGTNGYAFVGVDPWYYAEPLDQRAWALQERLLSRRTLQYTSVGLLASCRVSEFAIANEQTYNNAGRTLPESLQQIWRSGKDRKKDRADLLEAWDELLPMYTKRLLSNKQDKLPALSGLASRFQQRLQSDYIAGIWSKYFREGLLWRGVHAFGYTRFRKELIPLRRIPTSKAPTWSWASVEGPVASNYAETYREITLRILECTVALKDLRVPFGEVTGGLLHVKGFFRDCTCKPSSSGQQARLDVDSIGLDITPDDFDEWSAALKGTTIRLLEVEREKQNSDGMENERKLLRFWQKSSAYRSFGLMLQLVANGRYRRLGYFFEEEPIQRGYLFQDCSKVTIAIE